MAVSISLSDSCGHIIVDDAVAEIIQGVEWHTGGVKPIGNLCPYLKGGQICQSTTTPFSNRARD